MKTYSPAQLAERAGVTVRTLHHYEALGLLQALRTEAGHRRYREVDALRLRRIVWLRQLGFSLERISTLIDAPCAQLAQALAEQQALLRAELDEAAQRLQELEQLRTQLSQLPENSTMQDLTPPRHQGAPFADEAEQRWGQTPQWQQSKTRQQQRSSADEGQMQLELDQLMLDWANAMKSGDTPDSAAAQQLAQRHRAHISRWHYDCPLAMHKALAQMYSADARFADYFDRFAPGLAAYVVATIEAG